MMLLRTVAPWLLLAFLGQHVCLSSADRAADRGASAAGGRAQRSGEKSAPAARGKFSTKEKMQCGWVAKDMGDSMKVKVTCENPEARITGGVTDRGCDYDGKPKECPGYRSNPKGFWKQVGRAFKKLQGKVCTDDRALVKAGMCKRAPKDAHFKLDIETSVASAQSGGYPSRTRSTTAKTTTPSSSRITESSNCTSRAEQQKTAEEYCSIHWASVCAFFMSILQGDDC